MKALALGVALARLKNEQGTSNADTSDNQEYLSRLKSIRNRLKKSSAIVETVLEERIPEKACEEPPQLTDQEEFYTAYLLEYAPREHDRHCTKLSKHINDCFLCFNQYSDITRDFLHASTNI